LRELSWCSCCGPGRETWASGVIQPPKVYPNDSGLLAHSLGATVDRLRSEGNLAGAVLENFVLMELRKQCAWSATRPELFYWRTASGQEVDIVVEDRAGRVVGIEVKKPQQHWVDTIFADCRHLQTQSAKNGFAASCSMPAQRSFHSQPISTEFLWVDSGLSGKSDSCANTKKRTEIRHSGRAISCNVSMQWWLLWEPWDRVFSNLQATLGKTTFEHH
jgi:hypothetical protein